MSAQEFNYKFMMLNIKARIEDGVLTIKQGPRRFKAEIARLRHLYIIEHENVGYELILTHEVGPNKLKRIRTNGDFKAPAFQELVDTLVQLRPEIDIREMPMAEAHKLMGAANFVGAAPWIVVALITGMMAVFLSPQILHGFDGDPQTIDVSKCQADCDIQSKKLVLKGRILVDASIAETTTSTQSGSTSTSVRYFFPMVPNSWKKGDPVYWVIETPELTDDELRQVDPQKGIPGTLRDIFWEGLEDEGRNFFTKEYGLTIAEDVRLVEYKANTQVEFYIGIGVTGFVFVLMLIISIVIKRKQKAGKA